MEVEKVDIWKETIQNAVDQLKDDQEKMKQDIQDLKTNDKLQDQQINSIKEDLKEIKEDTKWLRRAITNAIIITAIGLLAGLIIAGIKFLN